MGCNVTRNRIRNRNDGVEQDLITLTVQPGEPIFILLGRDKAAGGRILDWVCYARSLGSPKDKLEDAVRIAKDFEAWEPKKIPD